MFVVSYCQGAEDSSSSPQRSHPNGPPPNEEARSDDGHSLPAVPKSMLAASFLLDAKKVPPGASAQERPQDDATAGHQASMLSGAESRTDVALSRRSSSMRRDGGEEASMAASFSSSSAPLRTSAMTTPATTTTVARRESKKKEDPSHPISAVTLPPDEFIERFRANSSECLHNAYMAERSIQSSSSGSLFTSLAEDVALIISAQLDVLGDYLSASSLPCTTAGDNLLSSAARAIVRNLWSKQIEMRDALLEDEGTDVEVCCAAANDFFRLMDVPDDMLGKMRERYPHMKEDEDSSGVEGALPTGDLSDLSTLYASDAVYAAQMVHKFTLDDFQAAVDEGEVAAFFSPEWEVDLTHNEVAVTMIRMMEGCLECVEAYLGNRLLYKKAADAMVSATVVFHIKMLLLRSKEVRAMRQEWKDSLSLDRGEEPAAFAHPKRALRRMDVDVQTLRTFFDELAENLPALRRVVERKFSALTAVLECLQIAAESPSEMVGAGAQPDSLSEFTVVLHTKVTGCRFDFTWLLVSDLFNLAAPEAQQAVAMEEVELLEDDLNKLNINVAVGGDQLSQQEELSECARIPGLRLDLVLAEIYGDDTRRRERSQHSNKKSSRWGIGPSTESFSLATARQMAEKLKKEFSGIPRDFLADDSILFVGPHHLEYKRCDPSTASKLRQLLQPMHGTVVRSISPMKKIGSIEHAKANVKKAAVVKKHAVKEDFVEARVTEAAVKIAEVAVGGAADIEVTKAQVKEEEVMKRQIVKGVASSAKVTKATVGKEEIVKMPVRREQNATDVVREVRHCFAEF